MSRKHESITLSISPQHKAVLEKMAIDAGYKWGDGRPNISAWLRAIADLDIPQPSTRRESENALRERLAKIKKTIAKLSKSIEELEE